MSLFSILLWKCSVLEYCLYSWKSAGRHYVMCGLVIQFVLFNFRNASITFVILLSGRAALLLHTSVLVLQPYFYTLLCDYSQLTTDYVYIIGKTL